MAQEQATTTASQAMPHDRRTRSDVDSWVEIASQPSSSSLSSVADDIITTGLRVKHNERFKRRRRTLRPDEVMPQDLPRQRSQESTSSQEEFDESESESDRVMSSSGEVQAQGQIIDSDDENRTAVNYPIKAENCFTPQPNAFSHPPVHKQDSYFQAQSHTRPSPRSLLGASYNAATHHDEALRASLSTLLSCAAAARGLKDEVKRVPAPRPQPMTFKLVPESALPPLEEPVFRPTLRRGSTTTLSTSPDRKEKRRSRPSSKERRAVKKARHITNEELYLTPTLLTWVVSAGVVVILSALSFSAGYGMGKEAGRIEAFDMQSDDVVRHCAREAGRSGLGLKRSLARSAVAV